MELKSKLNPQSSAHGNVQIFQVHIQSSWKLKVKKRLVETTESTTWSVTLCTLQETKGAYWRESPKRCPLGAWCWSTWFHLYIWAIPSGLGVAERRGSAITPWRPFKALFADVQAPPVFQAKGGCYIRLLINPQVHWLTPWFCAPLMTGQRTKASRNFILWVTMFKHLEGGINHNVNWITIFRACILMDTALSQLSKPFSLLTG